jgi:hypothetical protein
MDAVKEAQIEQRLDDLSRQFQRAEERNREEHCEIRGDLRAEIGGLRAEMNDGFRSIRAGMDSYNRTLIVTMGSLVVAIVASLAAAAASVLL